MNLLARFDPGRAVTGFILVYLAQTSIVILMAGLCSHTFLRRRHEARHSLWLGTLASVLAIPAVATIADRANIWLPGIPLSMPDPGAKPAVLHRSSSRAIADPGSLKKVEKLNDGRVAFENEPPLEAMAVPLVDQRQLQPDRPAPLASKYTGSALLGGLTVLWVAVALVGLARMAVTWRRLGEISRSARPLDPIRHGQTLERVRAELGMSALAPVVTSPSVSAPVAIGVFFPRIVLPENLPESIEADAFGDVLVHECAHIIRCDLCVGLLQGLMGVFLWPHPLVHYASRQLTRAREEVCDNYVLRSGDPRRYARTLLALTERCLASAALRPGLGLLGARWTLADRVAGLLDPRRARRTHTTRRARIVVAAVLGASALLALSIRVEREARAEQAFANQDNRRPDDPSIPDHAVWSIEGIVVDEQERPVAGAVVHAREEADPAGAKTAADGKFTLWAGDYPMDTRELVAEANDGTRMGRVQFIPPRQFAQRERVRVMLMPARSVIVHIKDGAGGPISAAAVEAFDYAYQFHATTGPEGSALLRVPADARIPGVIALKAGAGFDYFENYRTTPPSPEFAFPPLPARITLTLDGARTVTIRAVDPTGRPVPGVVIKPFRPRKAGRIETINIASGATTRAMTDEQGIAVFDWLPKSATNGAQSGAVTFFVEPPRGFSGQGLRYTPGRPTELVAHLQRAARLTGSVRYPDGTPARGVQVIARLGGRGTSQGGTKTDADGRYVFERIPPGSSQMIFVNDENWASASLISDVMKDGQEQRGLDFTLAKGTIVRGRVTEGSRQQPAGNVIVLLIEEKGPLPKELRDLSARTYNVPRQTSTDAQGRYQLRVGPGRYQLGIRGDASGPGHTFGVDVHDEAEIVRDLVAEARAPVPETYIKGVVVEKTPTGDRPVAGAFTFRWPVRGVHKTDDEGRFMVEKTPGETALYAYAPGKGLAGFATLANGAETARVVVAPTGTVRGRVVDSSGKPRSRVPLRVQVARGAYASSPRFAVSTVVTDEDGRFTYRDAPVGSTGEFEVFHDRMSPTNEGFNRGGPRTVVSFEVRDVDPIAVPDLIVPAGKLAK